MWKKVLLCAVLFAAGDHYARFLRPRDCGRDDEKCRLRKQSFCWDGALINILGWMVLLQLGAQQHRDYQLDLALTEGEVTASVELRSKEGRWLSVFPIWEMGGNRYNLSFFPNLDKYRCRYHRRRHPELSYLAPFPSSGDGPELYRLDLARLRAALEQELDSMVPYTYFRLVLSSTFADGGVRREVPIVALFMADPEAFSKFFTIVSNKLDKGIWYKEDDLEIICKVVEKVMEFVFAFRSDEKSDKKPNEKKKPSWWEQNIGYVNSIYAMVKKCSPDDTFSDKEAADKMERHLRKWHELIWDSCDRIFISGQLIPLADRIEKCAPGLRDSESMQNIIYYRDKLTKRGRSNPCQLNPGPV